MPNQQTDVLIFGCGIAGLGLALHLADQRQVTVMTKTQPGDANTWYAQGGIAAAVGDTDSTTEHAQDTMLASDNLAVDAAVKHIIDEGPAVIQDLVDWGVCFSQGTDGFDMGMEGGHHARRILHAGDITGAEIGRALLARAQAHSNIRLLENHMAVDLITRRRKLKQQPDR